MKIQIIAAATAAALFAIAGVSLAQSGTDAKTKANGNTAAGAGQTAKPGKCADLTGEKREQCMKDEKKPAGAGSSGTKKPGNGAGSGASGSGTK